MYLLPPIWPICHMCICMKIHAFEDSNNMQENLSKQWKYFPTWRDTLVQTFLCIVHFFFVKMVNSSLLEGGNRRCTNLWWILANECVENWIQTTVKLWRQRKITPFMPLNLSIFLRGLHPAIFFWVPYTVQLHVGAIHFKILFRDRMNTWGPRGLWNTV